MFTIQNTNILFKLSKIHEHDEDFATTAKSS